MRWARSRRRAQHGFESDEHFELFLAQAESRDVSAKFAFSGSAASIHDTYAGSIGYRIDREHVRIAGDAIASLGLDEAQICDIGPGDGQRAGMLLSVLRSDGCAIKRYLGLDFSERLMEFSIPRVLGTNGGISASAAQWDLEAGATLKIEEWRTEESPLVVLLLGITLGNVLDISNSLANLRGSLRAGDFVLFEIGLAAKSGEISLAPYRSPLFQTAIRQPFQMAGLSNSDIQLELVIEDRAVVCYAVLSSPLIGERPDVVVCSAGTRIRCFVSRRFDSVEVYRILAGNHFLSTSKALEDGNGNCMMMTRIAV